MFMWCSRTIEGWCFSDKQTTSQSVGQCSEWHWGSAQRSQLSAVSCQVVWGIKSVSVIPLNVVWHVLLIYHRPQASTLCQKLIFLKKYQHIRSVPQQLPWNSA